MLKIIKNSEQLLEQYYNELDTQKRKNLLCEYIEENPYDELNELRKELFKLRYQEKEDADKFLWHYVNLAYVYKNSKSKFFKKSSEKEFKQTINELGFDIAESYGEDGELELYNEFVNSCKRFLSVCADDKSYKKRFMGLSTISDNATSEKLAKDVWVLSVGLKENFPAYSEKLEPFSQAVVEAFSQLYENAHTLLEAV